MRSVGLDRHLFVTKIQRDLESWQSQEQEKGNA